MLRLSACALALFFSASAFAQATCTNGSALLGGIAYPCSGIDVAAVIPVGSDGPLRTGALNDIWGWTDPQDGSEYALVGTRSGVVFVDVTTPEAPRVLGKLQTAVFQGYSTWRDIKTVRDFAVVVAEVDNHGMQVFDLKRLRGLTADPSRDFEADARYTGFSNAHNIVADEESGFVFGVGATAPVCGGEGLHIVDLNEPLAPTYAGCFDDDGYTHDAQCVVYRGPDVEHAGKQICVASNEDTITIVDVTDKSNPIQLSRGFYPNPRYTHQGWFTEDQRYFVVDDEVDTSASGTRTMTFDLADLDNPDFVGQHLGTLATRDHNQYIRGNYSFQSNYEGGLRILSLDDVASGALTEVAYFDTYPQSDNEDYNGQWSNYPYFASGTVVASDTDNGLFVLRPNAEFVSVANEEAPTQTPEAYSLGAPEPNPASGAATLALRVGEAQQVSAAVYDLTGRRVADLLDRTLAAGSSVDLVMDGSALPAGVYVVRVVGETFEAARRVSVVR